MPFHLNPCFQIRIVSMKSAINIFRKSFKLTFYFKKPDFDRFNELLSKNWIKQNFLHTDNQRIK